MEIVDIEDFNTNYELCKRCEGKCCKKQACDCSPEDFDNDIEKMRLALQSGNYCIDFAKEDASSFFKVGNQIFLDTSKVKESPYEFFYIRPKNISRPTVDLIHSEADEGPCIFWDKDKGCPLKYKERPKGGRTMVPFLVASRKHCMLQYNKVLMMLEWKPFTDGLIHLIKEFFDENWIIYKSINFKLK